MAQMPTVSEMKAKSIAIVAKFMVTIFHSGVAESTNKAHNANVKTLISSLVVLYGEAEEKSDRSVTYARLDRQSC